MSEARESVAVDSHRGEADAEIQLVGGPRPYLWIGGEWGAFATLDIPQRLERRTANLLRDLADAQEER